MRLIFIVLTCTAMLGCSVDARPSTNKADRKAFNDYWYVGDAEITSFRIEQARYGEIHTGEGVLIFVTEDYSAKK